jgi:hypothetical protein
MKNLAPERFQLSYGERDSAVWQRLSAHFEARINTLHVKLEGDQTPEQTAILRGQIRAYKEILSLAKDLPPQT